jgi:hypothetical protein
MFEKRYDLLILQYKARQISSIRTDELVDLVLNTSHYADMTSDMAFLSSENVVWNCVHLLNAYETLFFSKYPHKNK